MLFILYIEKMIALLLLNVTSHILFIPKMVQIHTFSINNEVTVNTANIRTTALSCHESTKHMINKL